MRCETTVGTEKRKRLVGVSLNAINYRHGAHGEITYFNHRAKRANRIHVYIIIIHSILNNVNIQYNNYYDSFFLLKNVQLPKSTKVSSGASITN